MIRCARRRSRLWRPSPAEPAAVHVRVQRLPAPGKPVGDYSGHEPGDEFDGLQGRGVATHTDIQLDDNHAIHDAELVLRRLPVGQLSGLGARMPVRQQEAASVQHLRHVVAGHRQPNRSADVRRACAHHHPIRAGPVVCVHVPNGARHHGSVGAAERAQPACRVHHEWHTAGHYDHAGRVRRAGQHPIRLADRLLCERRRRARVDRHLAAAGRRVHAQTPVRRSR